MPKRARNHEQPLSRRERQVLSFLYAKGKASAAEIHEQFPDFPSYNAVRSTLRVLETKGHVRHVEQGRQYVYQPTIAKERARRSWLQQLVQSMFGGSATALVNTLIDEKIATPDELVRLEQLIRAARRGEK